MFMVAYSPRTYCYAPEVAHCYAVSDVFYNVIAQLNQI